MPSDPEPWFLPPAPEPADTPLPRADHRPLVDPARWRAAEADCAADLAQAAFRFGLLSARLAAAPPAHAARLAMAEVAELSWFAGDRIAPDRLSLWLALRASAARDDAVALARAGWAHRRLLGGPSPDAGGWHAGLSAFLGRPTAATATLADLLDQSAGLHPLTRAHLAFRAASLAADHDLAPFEGAVLASRIAAADRAAAPFFPLVLAGDRALRATGPLNDRLRLWITGAETAVRTALALLDRLALWQARAHAAAATPQARAIVDACAATPHLTAAAAAAGSGASRATAQRHLAALTADGVLRELTGQGRFRVWTARL